MQISKRINITRMTNARILICQRIINGNVYEFTVTPANIKVELLTMKSGYAKTTHVIKRG